MSLNSVDLDYVRDLVYNHSAIVVERGKSYLVESRLGPLVRQEGLSSIEELVAQMRARSIDGLHWKVVEAMTTNETSFYRDIHPFEALRKSVLPEILERRQEKRELNIWCAACSSGQEPYSIAMMLREYFPNLINWEVQVTATDISREMVDRSRAGRFSQLEINRGLPAPLVVKHFQRAGAEWEIKENIRRMIKFSWMNLAEAWPTMPQMDIIMMRNVLIYFDPERKKAILGKVARLIQPDGYLFLGGAETTLNLNDSFMRVQFGKATCYRLKS